MVLMANDADDQKFWCALGIEALEKYVDGEVESDWMVPLVTEVMLSFKKQV